MYRKMTAVLTAMIAYPAIVSAACVPSAGEFCVRLNQDAGFYFDAMAHEGMPQAFLDRRLRMAAMSHNPATENRAADQRLIAALGQAVSEGSMTRLDAQQELFERCLSNLAWR